MDESNPDSGAWLPLFRQRAAELGFINAGIAPAVDSAGFTDLVRWIESGYAAGMNYFADRLDAYRHADGVMAGTKSIIVLAYPYPADSDPSTHDGRGRVARYAWPGIDYHDTIHHKLKQLKRLVADAAPEVSTRGCVDTAPLLERELAQLAGLGWRGKNTLLLNRHHGSYFFLACFLVDVELPYDAPHATDHCGTCTACLDACPTDAFPAPGVLDASRCISYLTIEHRESIPPELREGIGSWVFGCDVCQEVCPWNRKPSRRSQTAQEDRPLTDLDLLSFFAMDEETFRATYRKSPLWRTRLRGIRRNAAIVLGNQGAPSALPALQRGAADEDEMVAEACRWAIKKITR
ncbi:Epoxyqueuosine reductase [Stieleria maiorica]|uniref:Epoxyqueuosine reductase n=1 Tax=Stieleria maiorica TaxID=2795974 RepID=A0A5B9MFT8_9BACT|nr:tRNA epoxyqueuosine(34) reductase QueG [Stieleria maiorica]QEF99379.1 Epoxyqueuosine reductase [Stieleria maiorica]